VYDSLDIVTQFLWVTEVRMLNIMFSSQLTLISHPFKFMIYNKTLFQRCIKCVWEIVVQ